MGLETGTYVNDLNTANPTSTDPKSQGDDHLRLIKSVLKNTFAGFQGLVVVTGTESQGATASDYVVTVAPAPAAYTAGFFVAFKATHANTGAATVQVNALGTKPLLAVDGTALKTGDIENAGLVVAFYDGISFYLVSGNDRADRNGDSYSGTHDFTGAVLRAVTKAFGSTGNEVATIDYVNNAAFQAALPAQTGKNGQVISSDGTSASWTSGGTAGQFLQRSAGGTPVWATVIPPNIQRSARTSDTMLVLADNQHLIDITSGTFAQTFDSSANLGNGWFCYLRNSGSGDITLTPNGVETIDGLSSYVMYPGEVRLMQCDGTAIQSIVLNAFYKVFTASGNFINPPGYKMFAGFLWGAGAGGDNMYHGGGGGGCLPLAITPSMLPASTSVVIASGGGLNSAGGNSSFGGFFAYGGKTGETNASGGGAGLDVTAIGGGNGAPLGLSGGRRGSAPASIGHSGWGGGGGAYYNAGNTSNSVNGGSSIYGGGGGGNPNQAGGTSLFGGNGATSSTAAGIPGGGGYQSGAYVSGARGECRIWGII